MAPSCVTERNQLWVIIPINTLSVLSIFLFANILFLIGLYTFCSLPPSRMRMIHSFESTSGFRNKQNFRRKHEQECLVV